MSVDPSLSQEIISIFLGGYAVSVEPNLSQERVSIFLGGYAKSKH